MSAPPWRADPHGGRARLLAEMAREFNAPDWLMTRVYLRYAWDLRPDPLAFQDLDAYVAACAGATHSSERTTAARVRGGDPHAPPRRGAQARGHPKCV